LATETARITERYVTLSHGRTRYFEAGVGFPTLLLHGAGFDNGAYVWLPNLPSLAPRLRVLALDSLNWGPGDVLDIELSFAYLVDHVREFMDALGIERANVVGHSMGGWLATLFAYESPERVNKLVPDDYGIQDYLAHIFPGDFVILNWRAVCGSTLSSAAPSRRCRCQSSGRVIVSLSMAPSLGERGAPSPLPRTGAP